MRTIFLLFLLFVVAILKADDYSDSLKVRLSYSKSETEKADILNKLAHHSRYSNSKLNYQYGNQALDISKKCKYELGILEANDNIATYHLLRGNLDSAEMFCLRAFELAKKSNNKRQEGLQYNTLGLIYLDKGDYSTAIQYLKVSAEVLEEFGLPGELGKPVNNLGLCYQLTGQHDKAISLYEKSLAICKENGDRLGVATNLGNLGVVYDDIGSFQQALGYYFESLDILEKIDDKSITASIYLSISNIHSRQGELESAMGFCINAYQLSSKLGDTKGVVSALINIGGLHSMKQQADSAIHYFEIAYKLAEEKGFKPEQATLLFNIAGLYFQLEQYKNALNYIERAAGLQNDINDRKGLVNSKLLIGKIKILRNQTNVGIILFEEALKISFSIGYIEGIKETSFELAHALEALGKKDLAFDYLNIHSQYKDSVMNQEKTRMLSELQARYKLDQMKKKNELLEKEKQLADVTHKNEQQRNRVIIYSALIGLILLFTLAVLFFSRNRIKKKANIILTQRNKEIEDQKEQLHHSHKIITDSIQYAKRIQESILPSEKEISLVFPESFVFFRPKDVVSGDFYWFSQQENFAFLAIVDCTGHGVPGAFMSMIGHTLLSEIVNEKEIYDTSEILFNLNKGVIKALKQGEYADDAQNDGMVVSLLRLDKNSGEVCFAGANNSIFIIKNRKLQHIEGDIYNIGGYFSQSSDIAYTTHCLSPEKGSMIYLFTDGYKDQFGGVENKKYMASRFESLLIGLSEKSLVEQLSGISGEFEGWKGNTPQMDDVLIFGLRV